jgi:O-glycosyl hydrolase
VPVSLYGEEPRQAMTLSAKPNGLLPEMQRPWANYFSKWISAYKGHGIDVWAVTVQNEPEATAGWEAMLWTPEFMASFVRDHLGPVLADDHPAVSIFGFDHNKDHVTEWTKALYEDEAAKAYFAGVGVHWYGGLNTDKLQATHDLAPEKAILATEVRTARPACPPRSERGSAVANRRDVPPARRSRPVGPSPPACIRRHGCGRRATAWAT